MLPRAAPDWGTARKVLNIFLMNSFSTTVLNERSNCTDSSACSRFRWTHTQRERSANGPKQTSSYNGAVSRDSHLTFARNLPERLSLSPEPTAAQHQEQRKYDDRQHRNDAQPKGTRLNRRHGWLDDSDLILPREPDDFRSQWPETLSDCGPSTGTIRAHGAE